MLKVPARAKSGQQLPILPVLQQLSAALGVPALAVASAAPVTQAAVTAPRGGGEALSLRGAQGTTMEISCINEKMDGKAIGPI